MRISKWRQYAIMTGDEMISPYVPETHLLTKEVLWGMLDKYKKVIIKPNWGKSGHGVIQLSMTEEDKYEIHHGYSKITIKGREQTYNYINKKYLTTRYIVQQKVPLATIGGSPFDLRVMVQRKKNCSQWKVTGKVAKVAQKGFVITNVVRDILPVVTSLKNSSVKEIDLQELLFEINQTVILAAIRLQKYYPRCRMIGFDIGIDQQGNIWIIEANFHPMISVFKWLEDKSMYRTIKRYQNRKR